MSSGYFCISIYAGNYRADGRQKGPKPSAAVHGIGSKRSMTNLAEALTRYYNSNNVIVEVLRCESASTRYYLMV